MMALFQKTLSFIRRRWILSAVVVILIVIVVLISSRGGKSLSTAKIERGDVVSLVSVTGTVKPAKIIDLAFAQSGRLTYLGANVGDKVSEGQILAHLDNADLQAQVAQADANVATEQAKLESLVKGTRPEDLAAKAAALQKTKADLANDYASALNALNDSYVKADDAVHNQIAAFFTNGDSNNPQLTFSSSNSQAQTDAQNDRIVVQNALVNWSSEMGTLQGPTLNTDGIYSEVGKSQGYLNSIRSLLNRLMDALTATNTLNNTYVTTYETNLTTARNNINIASSNLSAQQQAIDGQRAFVDQTQSEYNLLVAGSTKEDIDAQSAQVQQAQANAQYARAQLEKTMIRALFSGTVTKTPFNQGDLVTANSPVVSMIGSGTYQIEADIAESDIAKVKVGESASVTLDAYGPQVVFDAKVSQIDLSSTIIEGVATYKTEFDFPQNDPRIIPGLTANIDILSARRDNVLFVPTRDIVQDGDNNYLDVVVNSKTKETKQVQVTLGLQGSDGRTEIISGVNEGDLVIAE